MKFFILFILLLLSPFLKVIAQGISISADGSPPDSSAILDIQSNTKGMLIPRMTIEQRDAILLPVYGLIIFQTDGIPGMYYYDGTSWSPVDASSLSGGWAMNGDDLYNTNAGKIGIGTSVPESTLHIRGSSDVSHLIIDANVSQNDSNPLIRLRKSNGIDLMWINSDRPGNIFIGESAGKVNITEAGVANTFVGYRVGFSNTTGYFNTIVGSAAFIYNTSGKYNTVAGTNSLQYNTIGSYNTAIGVAALYVNTIGNDNTAIGAVTLQGNRSACQNTAVGSGALNLQSFDPDTAWISGNTAVGYNSLHFNYPLSTANGINNTAIGSYSSYKNSTGWDNTSIGVGALYTNQTGEENTAIGRQALFYNRSEHNTAVGYKALRGNDTGSDNTAVGYDAFLNGAIYTNSTALGSSVDITASNQVRIGHGVNSIGGPADWTNTSDARIKLNINEDVPGLEFIQLLHPVTYTKSMKLENEITGRSDSIELQQDNNYEKIRHTGFLAQEVERAAKSIDYDFSGVDAPQNDHDLYGLRYGVFVVPLVKAVQEQQSMIDELVKANQVLIGRIEALEKKNNN